MRRLLASLALVCAFFVVACGGAVTPPAPSALATVAAAPTPLAVPADIARSGVLRVAINSGNAQLARKDPQTGELRGIAVDLGKELASRLGVRYTPIDYANVTKVFEAVPSAAWDIAFIPIDASRQDVAFSPAYMEVNNTYLVPAGSTIRTIADADQTGIRIAVAANSATDLFLIKDLKRAQLVRADTAAGAFELLRAGKADALAGAADAAAVFADQLPDSRVIEGRIFAGQQAIAVIKGQGDLVRYVSRFVEDAKSSGLVQRSIDSAGLRGVVVAPPAGN